MRRAPVECWIKRVGGWSGARLFLAVVGACLPPVRVLVAGARRTFPMKREAPNGAGATLEKPFENDVPATPNFALTMTSSCCSLKMITIIVSALVLALHYQETEAKRGCANFGHSCYGGMGKRDGPLDGGMVIDDSGKLEENPALIFAGSRGDYRPEREVYVSPFMRQLLRNLRTAQQQLQQRDVFDEK